MVIPAVAVQDAFRLATGKVTKENHTRAELIEGVRLREVSEKYGVH